LHLLVEIVDIDVMRLKLHDSYTRALQKWLQATHEILLLVELANGLMV